MHVSTGLPVVAVLRDPAPHNGKRIGFPSTFDQPISAYIQGFERVVGKPVRLHVRQPNADDAQPLVEIAAWLKGCGLLAVSELKWGTRSGAAAFPCTA